MLAVTEQDERPQRRIVLELRKGGRQLQACRRIDAVLDERPVEADEHDVVATFNGDGRRRAERHVAELRRCLW